MELNAYLDILKRRWRTAVLVPLVVICLGALGSLFIPPKYQAEARLRIVTPLGGASGETNYQTTFANRLMNTYAQIATSEQVRNELKEKLGLTTLPDITVQIIPDSEIIHIVVEGSDTSIIAKTANTLAQILLSYHDNGQENTDSTELNILTERRNIIQTELVQYQDEHEQLVQTYSQTTADMNVLERAIRLKEASYQSLQQQYQDALISGATFTSETSRATKDALMQEMDRAKEEMDALNQQYKDLSVRSSEYLQRITLVRLSIDDTQRAYSDLLSRYDSVLLANSRQENAQKIIIVSSASVPSRPVGPSRTLVFGLMVGCGLIAGIVTAFVVDNLDTRVFSPEQIGRVTRIPVIGTISKFRDHQAGSLPDVTDPVAGWDYRMLRARLQILIQESSVKTILLTSPNRAEGKSTITYKLALGLAQDNFRVLIVDADLHKPIQHKLFKVTAEHGLCDFLNDEQDNLNDIILRAVRPCVDLLPSLIECDDPTELLQSPRMKTLFASLHGYDVVLFDTPAFLAVPDALALAEDVDSVVVVAQSEHTTSADIQSVCNSLESVGSRVLGIVLNQVPARKDMGSY